MSNEAKGLRFSFQLTLGDLVTIVTLLTTIAGGSYAWSQINFKVADHDKRISALEQTTDEVKSHQALQDTAIAVLQDKERLTKSN